MELIITLLQTHPFLYNEKDNIFNPSSIGTNDFASEDKMTTLEEYLNKEEWELEQDEEKIQSLLEESLKNGNFDFSFDPIFNEVATNRNYEANLDSTVEFIAFENNFDALYKYFQYTKRYVKALNNTATVRYNEERQDDIAFTGQVAEAFDYYNDQIIIFENFINNNNEATLLMIYRLFERLLKDIVELLDNTAAELKCQGDFSVIKYMSFLKKKNVFIPKELYYEYDMFRLIRNHIVHGNDTVSNKLQSYLKNDPFLIWAGCDIIVNVDYVEHAFTIIGKIAKSIETAILVII